MPITHSTNELPAFEYDRRAVDSFRIYLGKADEGNRLPLQLPPRISGETKQNQWHTNHHMGFEPIVWWKGADARRIEIEFDYVVWGSWSVDKIRNQLRRLKLFYYVGGPGIPDFNEETTNNDDKMPIMRIGGWDMVHVEGSALPTFRVDGVGLQYSPEKVGNGSKWWPLKTTVKLTCHLWTSSGWQPNRSPSEGGDVQSTAESLNHGPMSAFNEMWA